MSDAGPFASLGEHLKRTRIQSKESLAEVSGSVEIDEKSLERIESGIERPAEDILLLLISHFGVHDAEALRLWQLADYDTELPDQFKPDIDLVNGSKVVMLMAMDMRTLYTDGFTVEAGDNGVTLQFTQTSGKNQSSPVSRIGMSYDQAEDVLAKIGQEILKHRYTRGNLSLSSGESNSEKQAK